MDDVKRGKIELPSSAFVLNPYKEIDDAASNGNWTSAFATAVTFFEYYGRRIIRKRGESLQMRQLDDDISRMTVASIIFTLRVLNIIDETTYKDMKEVNTQRNNLIHLDKQGDPSETTKLVKRYSLQESRAKPLLQKAKECIQKLVAIVQ